MRKLILLGLSLSLLFWFSFADYTPTAADTLITTKLQTSIDTMMKDSSKDFASIAKALWAASTAKKTSNPRIAYILWYLSAYIQGKLSMNTPTVSQVIPVTPTPVTPIPAADMFAYVDSEIALASWLDAKAIDEDTFDSQKKIDDTLLAISKYQSALYTLQTISAHVPQDGFKARYNYINLSLWIDYRYAAVMQDLVAPFIETDEDILKDETNQTILTQSTNLINYVKNSNKYLLQLSWSVNKDNQGTINDDIQWNNFLIAKNKIIYEGMPASDFYDINRTLIDQCAINSHDCDYAYDLKYSSSSMSSYNRTLNGEYETIDIIDGEIYSKSTFYNN